MSLILPQNHSPSTTPAVLQLQAKDAEQWTQFLAGHPRANLYHTLLWKNVIEDAFGHKPIYLFSRRKDTISGVLPMFLIKFPFLGSKLISLPYDIGSGGILADDEESEVALIKHTIDLARDMNVNYIEFRYGAKQSVLPQLGLMEYEPVVISEMKLDTEEQVWKRIKSDHRKGIRKAKNRGIEVREANNLEDFLKFYQVYIRVFRDFGTPPYSANYFRILCQKLHSSQNVRLALAYKDNRCVGGLLLFYWKQTLISKFAVCLPEVVPLRAYMPLYWWAIKLGLELNCNTLSWGTSPRNQPSLIEFKERWGAESRSAIFYNLPIKRKVPSIEMYYDTESIVRKTWKKLPLRVTSLLGGHINRWFG